METRLDRLIMRDPAAVILFGAIALYIAFLGANNLSEDSRQGTRYENPSRSEHSVSAKG